MQMREFYTGIIHSEKGLFPIPRGRHFHDALKLSHEMGLIAVSAHERDLFDWQRGG